MSCLPNLLEKFSNLILCLEDDANPDPLWQRFYQIQMASYIMGNYTEDFELSNAIQAYEKILDKWSELETYLDASLIPIKNYDNLFKQVLIDFS